MWDAEIHLRVLGTSFAINSTSAPALMEFRRLVEIFVLDRPMGVPARRRYSIVETQDEQFVTYRDCARLSGPTNVGSAWASLMASINRQTIEEYEGFAAHAGVVSSTRGVIAIPADSGGGKSTLTAALIRSGFAYGSDEALCIDVSSGDVVPYPKPMALDGRSLSLLGLSFDDQRWGQGEQLVTPEQLGAVVMQDRETVRHVVLPELGFAEPRIEEIPASEALAHLLRMSFNHYKLGATAFHLVASVCNSVRAWRLACGPPMPTAELMGRTLT